MTTSKKLLIFASAIYALMQIVVMVSWFVLRDIPGDLLYSTTGMYTAAIAAYCGKSAYENKYKIVHARADRRDLKGDKPI